jgi:hypothetical protein
MPAETSGTAGERKLPLGVTVHQSRLLAAVPLHPQVGGRASIAYCDSIHAHTFDYPYEKL